jgi:hypothetical protein
MRAPRYRKRNRGARGDYYPPRYRRCKSAPVSGNPLTPRYRQEFGEPAATIRPVTGVAKAPGAPLPHQRPQFRSRSGRLHPHQATASTVTPGLDVNTEGNCNRERDCIALRMEPGNYAHQQSMANIGTACVRVADYARPATLTNTIGTAHGATTSAVAKREKSRKYLEVSQAPLAGDYARPAEWPYRSRKPPRPATYRTARTWPGG